MVFVRFLSGLASADSINTHTESDTPSPTHAGRAVADGPSWAAAGTIADASSRAAIKKVLGSGFSQRACAALQSKSKHVCVKTEICRTGTQLYSINRSAVARLGGEIPTPLRRARPLDDGVGSL